jgi:hypothetical protein
MTTKRIGTNFDINNLKSNIEGWNWKQNSIRKMIKNKQTTIERIRINFDIKNKMKKNDEGWNWRKNRKKTKQKIAIKIIRTKVETKKNKWHLYILEEKERKKGEENRKVHRSPIIVSLCICTAPMER